MRPLFVALVCLVLLRWERFSAQPISPSDLFKFKYLRKRLRIDQIFGRHPRTSLESCRRRRIWISGVILCVGGESAPAF